MGRHGARERREEEQTTSLQTRTVDDLDVNDDLTSLVADDQGAEAASSAAEGINQALPEVGLVEDGNGLLDITSLGHGSDYRRSC